MSTDSPSSQRSGRVGPSARTRVGRRYLVSATLLLLAACGGGEPPVHTEHGAHQGQATDPAADLQSRRFTLWAPGAEAALLAEQQALDPVGGEQSLRLIVRLNPAAVQPNPRAAIAAGAGNGEQGDASALRARELAAKATAVATAADAVVAQSVRRLVPGAAVRQHFAHAIEGFVVNVPWAQAQAVADELARNPAVDAVEVDRAVRVDQASPATRILDAAAWGVDRIDQRARSFDGRFMHPANGRGVSIFVVDTGISPHSQFDTRLRAGFSTVNDGRGTADCHGHGTHVAGTAAGATLGVAAGASLVPVRVMDCRGSGSSSAIIAGLDWVATQGTRPGVVNMSLGGAVSTSIDAAVQRLMAVGFSVVAAAGNSNADACMGSPARAPGVVAVAASDQADAKASFSNWGACVSLWAPGVGITSAGPASATAKAVMSGTSMAAPHVAGAAALLLQTQPTLTAAQVQSNLKQQATPNLVMGVTQNMTRGLLFVGGASQPAPPPPPQTVVQVAGITMATQMPAIGSWSAQALVRVVNNRAQPVAGARVAGRFSNMTAEVSCTTAASGTCSLSSAAAAWGAMPTIGFAVTGVTGTQMAYGGAGVRSAQATQPAAPVASVSAITGSMVRPAANSPQWKPQFALTVRDERGNAVAGALVQTTLSIHAGARVVGLQTAACQTAATGQCNLLWSGPTLGASHTGAVLTVQGVSRPFLVYRAGPVTRAVVGQVQ